MQTAVFVNCFNSLQVGYKQQICNILQSTKKGFNSLQVGYKRKPRSTEVHHKASFNSLQVGYKPSWEYTLPENHDPGFNSLQVGYKHNSIDTVITDPPQFQFLIGWLQTMWHIVQPIFHHRFNSLQVGYKRVNGGHNIIKTRVSIPYRLATNITVSILLLQIRLSFNSLQVGYKRCGIQFSQYSITVSIPYRLATNE